MKEADVSRCRWLPPALHWSNATTTTMNKLAVVIVATLAFLASCQAAVITRETRNNAEAACLQAFPLLTPEQCSELADLVAELWFLGETSLEAPINALQGLTDDDQCPSALLAKCASKLMSCSRECHEETSCKDCLGNTVWHTCCPCVSKVLHIDPLRCPW
ncbi:hypothetical protein QOT17_019003 [Balamuthia mandrillaris]